MNQAERNSLIGTRASVIFIVVSLGLSVRIDQYFEEALSPRGLSNEEVEQVFTRDPRMRCSPGAGAPWRVPSLWAAIESIASKIGCVPKTLNEWVNRVEFDNGNKAGVKSPEQAVTPLNSTPKPRKCQATRTC